MRMLREWGLPNRRVRELGESLQSALAVWWRVRPGGQETTSSARPTGRGQPIFSYWLCLLRPGCGRFLGLWLERLGHSFVHLPVGSDQQDTHARPSLRRLSWSFCSLRSIYTPSTCESERAPAKQIKHGNFVPCTVKERLIGTGTGRREFARCVSSWASTLQYKGRS